MSSATEFSGHSHVINEEVNKAIEVACIDQNCIAGNQISNRLRRLQTINSLLDIHEALHIRVPTTLASQPCLAEFALWIPKSINVLSHTTPTSRLSRNKVTSVLVFKIAELFVVLRLSAAGLACFADHFSELTDRAVKDHGMQWTRPSQFSNERRTKSTCAPTHDPSQSRLLGSVHD